MADSSFQPLQPTTPQSVAETVFLPSDDDSGRRLANDVALATELLSCGALTERQVAETLANWSLYGSVSLRQHLQNTGLLSPQQLQEIDAQVAQTIAQTPLPEPRGESDNPVASTIARFDTTGRVARLLGVSTAVGAELQGEGRTGLTRYRLIRLLGQGGLGRVWLARDWDLQRLVALKEISATRENAASVQRLRNEAEITGRLEHPGIVPVYQLASDAESGRTFYTMRFLGKGTLQDSIAEYHERRADGDEDPMLLRHLLSAFVRVCHAIGHAHSRKVIHRDLKPENVVIDSFGQVIVIDWGLAKLLDDAELETLGKGSPSGDVGRTSEGQVLGTPLFMAPEQASGRLDELDARTDVYGLGAILFAICTGRPPHEATHARSTAGASHGKGTARELFTAISSGPTPQAAEINPDVDPVLAAICAKAMARKRYARYQQASALAEDVERWMAGEPVSAYAEPPGRRARRWIRHHQRLSQLIAGMAGLALAAIATVGVTLNHNRVVGRQTQYQALVGDVREVSLRIRSIAHDLGKQSRFMATLPEIQEIVRARDVGDAEAEWLGRLETIYHGLMRANPDFLAVTLVAAESPAEANQDSSTNSEGAVRRKIASVDVMRVERNAIDRSYVRTVPRSRKAATDDDTLLADVFAAELGGVVFSMNPRSHQAALSSSSAVVRRMIAAVRVFDETTGDPFGMVMIETDMNAMLAESLAGLGEVVGEVYVADGQGRVWIDVRPRQPPTPAADGTLLAEVCPEAKKLVETDRDQFRDTDGTSYFGQRFREQPRSRGVILFARLPKSE